MNLVKCSQYMFFVMYLLEINDDDEDIKYDFIFPIIEIAYFVPNI